MVSIIFLSCCKEEEVTGADKDNTVETAYDYVVAKDGTGDFVTVQEAFDAVPDNSSERIIIFIKKGIYKEVLELNENKKNITIIGENASEVILTYDNYASKINSETGKELGTSGSSSTYIYGEGFYALNVTFRNDAGPVGQALAIYIGADKAVFVNCKFLGHQDTMYGGRSRQYFRNCYIEGSTDFIFGPSTAFFDNCQLFSKGGSAITAASTENYVIYGYVFKDCSISGSGNNVTTLGRPWRPYAAVAFINTKMSASIQPEGWNNWGNPNNEGTVRYAEYQSSGEGATPSQRIRWVKKLSKEEADLFNIRNVLKTTYSTPPTVDNWNPEAVIELTNKQINSIE